MYISGNFTLWVIACSLNKSDVNSLDFDGNRLFTKIVKTKISIKILLNVVVKKSYLSIVTIKVADKPTSYVTRKGGNYSDVLPFKAARCDSISNLTSCGASSLSRRQIQCRCI